MTDRRWHPYIRLMAAFVIIAIGCAVAIPSARVDVTAIGLACVVLGVIVLIGTAP